MHTANQHTTVQGTFCADEVFCGRDPERGTETCTVVEHMASFEQAFATLGQPETMDRVERLAFNALPAALTADMWTHVRDRHTLLSLVVMPGTAMQELL